MLAQLRGVLEANLLNRLLPVQDTVRFTILHEETSECLLLWFSSRVALEARWRAHISDIRFERMLQATASEDDHRLGSMTNLKYVADQLCSDPSDDVFRRQQNQGNGVTYLSEGLEKHKNRMRRLLSFNSLQVPNPCPWGLNERKG